MQTLLTAVVFTALDALWLGVAMSDFYKTELGTLARRAGEDFAPVWWAALAVYVVLVVGLMVFVLPRVEGRPRQALGLGALFGLVTYGTYDFTAYAVLEGWSLRMTLVDLVWGATICGLTSAAVTTVQPRLLTGDRSLPARPASTSPALR